MYEDESKKRKIKINWKSLLFKLVILLAVVFLVMLLISVVKKKDNNKKVESNFKTNFSYMQTTAKDYFKGSKLPTNINGRKKVTLRELIEENAIIEFKDQNNKACDMVESFIEATKVSDTDYRIKTKLTCGTESDYVIDNIKIEPIEEKNDNVEEENKNDNNTTTESDNKTNNSNQTTANKPSTSKPNNNINYVNKPSTNPEVKTCSYGDKSYDSSNVVAYLIPGDCAVAISDYNNGNYANNASSIGSTEYSKLYAEMVALEKSTGVSLDIAAPSYSAVYNKAGTGLVGYKILFTLKVKNTNNIIYEYYIDSNSNRKVVMDYRSSLYNYKNNNNNNTSNTLSAINMNIARLNLNVGDSYKLSVTFYPNNVTNKNISWISTNNSIVSVDSNGNIVAKRAGSVNIIARVDGKSTSTFVIVKESN